MTLTVAVKRRGASVFPCDELQLYVSLAFGYLQQRDHYELSISQILCRAYLLEGQISDSRIGIETVADCISERV